MSIKISQLSALSSITSDDFFPVVDSGSLTTQRVSAQQILNYITGSTFNSLTVASITGSAASVIDVSTTSTALRITQRGTGASIRVEDETNPDSTPFIIDAAGNLGLGLDTPLHKMHVSGNSVLSGTLIVTGSTTLASISGSSAQFTSITGSVILSSDAIVGATTIASKTGMYFINAGIVSFTITLPSPLAGATLYLTRIDSGTGLVSVFGNINGVAGTTNTAWFPGTTANRRVVLISNGTSWYPIIAGTVA
jgi:hypothetical protein